MPPLHSPERLHRSCNAVNLFTSIINIVSKLDGGGVWDRMARLQQQNLWTRSLLCIKEEQREYWGLLAGRPVRSRKTQQLRQGMCPHMDSSNGATRPRCLLPLSELPLCLPFQFCVKRRSTPNIQPRRWQNVGGQPRRGVEEKQVGCGQLRTRRHWVVLPQPVPPRTMRWAESLQ